MIMGAKEMTNQSDLVKSIRAKEANAQTIIFLFYEIHSLQKH
jgi:hypothetical protein